MKVEIDNTREIKEVVIGSDGTINVKLPEYAGYIANIVIINQKGHMTSIPLEIENTPRTSNQPLDPNGIEGLRHREGLPRSRQTAKDFSKLISTNLEVEKKDQSWIELKNGIHIRYSNSVVYESGDGDLLWYSLSYKDLVEHMKKAEVYLAFIIRESQRLVWVKADEVIDLYKKAAELRNNDWLHIHILFYDGKLKIHVKTGAGNEPEERELDKKKHYLNWSALISKLEG
jgi:hypothetical protein